MAADASAPGTTFEPRGPSLSIGTVGLFVNRFAVERAPHCVNAMR
jgi:hypothetical protein